MPQVAQQDYLYIRPLNATVVNQDAAALGQLRRALDNGTIADCLIYNARLDDGAEDPNISKVLSYYLKSGAVCIYDLGNGGIATIDVPYTQQQYEGLAAIQTKAKEKGYEYNRIPILNITQNDRLFNKDDGYIILADGNYLIVTAKEGEIAELVVGEKAMEDDFVSITWEDAQKLIGLPINR